MATITMLNVRRKGQGKEGHKKPVLFPKMVFLYDENLHGPGGELEDVFEAGIECSRKTMYPDWLSLTGERATWRACTNAMGRSSPPWAAGPSSPPGMSGAACSLRTRQDSPVFVGRFNVGVVSLHLPMILAKARTGEPGLLMRCWTIIWS